MSVWGKKSKNEGGSECESHSWACNISGNFTAENETDIQTAKCIFVYIKDYCIVIIQVQEISFHEFQQVLCNKLVLCFAKHRG